ncbi:MAG: hypothetical protein L6437_13940, partial [Kiritimatiellae bacterium]|nr:hypothetical protein [Kiritimatiellia bacterium]
EVRRRCADLAAGGGFIFCQVHNIQPNVPPENIAAMYAAVPGQPLDEVGLNPQYLHSFKINHLVV